MSQPAPRRMAADKFLEWQQDQDQLYELIDGQPVGMVGARSAHDRIAMSAAREIGVQLRGKPCRPFSEALAVLIPAGNVRHPDLGVDCDPFDGSATSAGKQKLVMEVLSRSTRHLDLFVKLDEYRSVASLDHILLMDPDAASVVLWSRDAARAWLAHPVEALEAVIALPLLGLQLPLTDLYEGLSLRPLPKLIHEAAT